MIILVKSDHTIGVNASLKKFAEGEANRILGRFATSLTRVKVHLSDIDSIKKGQLDKRCLVETRPAGSGPRIASARATKTNFAVTEAMEKMERALTKSFGRKKWTASVPKNAASAGTAAPRQNAAVKPAPRKPLSRKAALKEKIEAGSWDPQKKRVDAGRRTWPVR